MRLVSIRTAALVLLTLSLISIPPGEQNGIAQKRRTVRRSAVASGAALGAGVGGIRSQRRTAKAPAPGAGARVKARHKRLRKSS